MRHRPQRTQKTKSECPENHSCYFYPKQEVGTIFLNNNEDTSTNIYNNTHEKHKSFYVGSQEKLVMIVTIVLLELIWKPSKMRK